MELVFITGGAYRKVIIEKRIVSMITPELGFMPYTVDLDKIDKKQMEKVKLSEEEKKTIRQLAKLKSEEAMAKDIIKDFQKTGWRCIKHPTWES